MPAWSLRLAASLVLAMTLVGSVQYVSAHPKNDFAPLKPAVVADGEDVAEEEIEPPRPTVTPSPAPSPTPTPRSTAAPVRPTATPPPRTATPSPAPAVTPSPRPTLAAGVRTATLKPLARTKVS